MGAIIYPTFRDAMRAKVCHFCGLKMVPLLPGATGISENFSINDDGDGITYQKYYSDSNSIPSQQLKKCHLTGHEQTTFQDFEPIEKSVETTVFIFQCQQDHYRSDITIYSNPMKRYFIISSTEEEVTLIHGDQVFIVTNSFDTNKSSILVLSREKDDADYDNSFICDIYADLGHIKPIITPLKPFPGTIEQLLRRTLIHLTFS